MRSLWGGVLPRGKMQAQRNSRNTIRETGAPNGPQKKAKVRSGTFSQMSLQLPTESAFTSFFCAQEMKKKRTGKKKRHTVLVPLKLGVVGR